MQYNKSIDTFLNKHEGVFYIIKGRRMFKVNEIGARIYDLCNGINKETEIINIIAKKFNKSYEEIEDEVVEYIEDLLKLEIIK